MYRVKKVLNHNTIIGIRSEDNQEYLLIGKGLGFGKKIAERVEAGPKTTCIPSRKPQNVEMQGNWQNPFPLPAWKSQARY